MSINVIKHNGSKEPLDLSKAHASLEWACKGIDNVSISEIEIQSKLHFFEGIPTSFITDVFIKTCEELTSLKSIEYDQVARNLKLQKLYKKCFNSIKPPSLLEFLKQRIKDGHYSSKLLENPLINWKKLEKIINHSKDFSFTSSGLDSLLKSYSICEYETPQFIFMAVAIDIFRDYHQSPTDYIIYFYEYLSNYEITLPSPEMRTLRTDFTDYASCITFRVGDSIDSWKAGDNALLSHTVASAGVGVDIADIASVGDSVKDGKIIHSGKLPILKSIDTHVQKASQNGRRGSATGYVNFFDPEIESIFSLKSPRKPVEERINDLSYGIKLNQLAYDRAKENKPISLFSVRTAPDLYEAFYSADVDKFTKLYEHYESIEAYSSQINAQDFWERLIAIESTETSSYYIINIDEMNDNTLHTKPITQSNICVEYMTATEPISTKHPDRPDIGVCVLTNIVQRNYSFEHLMKLTELAVRAQSHIMLRQNHPTPQANAYVKQYRDIGIGITNHAHWLASNGLKYGSDEALTKFDNWMEIFSYGLFTASNKLAMELGSAPAYKYHNKILPINRYKRTVDKLIKTKFICNWDLLNENIKKYGLYNVGLSMIPPAETSSGPANCTTGLEPIRDLMTIKDKSGYNFKQFVPDCTKLADKYQFVFDYNINKDYLKHVAIAQKWIDKGISANTFYNPEWNNGKVLSSDVISDLFFAKYYGVKTRYYQNTKLPNEQSLESQCQGGCSV